MAPKGHVSVEEGAGYDQGTGAYAANPPVSVDLSHEAEGSTGAVTGPSEPTVYVSEDHEGAPTGAATTQGVATYTQDSVTFEQFEDKHIAANDPNVTTKAPTAKKSAATKK